MKEIIVDGVSFVEKHSESPIKIVILQRAWNFVGRFERTGNDCKLTNAYVIRRWGTSEGLGQLAKEGKLSGTILDFAGVVEFDYLTIVATINCDEEKWTQI
jgi:hypothetical protein